MPSSKSKAAKPKAGPTGKSFFSWVRSFGRQQSQPKARMLRDSSTNVIQSRQVSLVDSRDEIRRVWKRSAAIALDLIQNSGRLKGAVDQVIGDTVGSELKLSPAPDLRDLGYSEEEEAEFIKLLKNRWKQWSWNPRECDFRGKLTVPQMVDIGLRYNFAYGELIALLDYLSASNRKRYGVETSTKVLMVPPHRLVDETNIAQQIFQGVTHDENGRPLSYRFRVGELHERKTKDYPAFDKSGRQVVVHIFDPQGAEDVRGISSLSACFTTKMQHDVLHDATLNTAIAQSSVAMVLTSKLPSAEAFEGLQEIKAVPEVDEDGNLIAGDENLAGTVAAYIEGSYQSAQDGTGLKFGGGPMVPNLTPDEDFEYKTPTIPGNNYIPFSQDLRREIARAIGISYSAYTMDFSDATYSSVRMETASIWPVVMRRRERIAAPLCQAIYEAWLDEQIGRGLIPFKGGYAAFKANRDKVVWAQWKGPAKPTADDLKTAKAANERISGGLSTVDQECAENGLDGDEIYAAKKADHKRHIDDEVPSPYASKASQPSEKPRKDQSEGDGGDEE